MTYFNYVRLWTEISKDFPSELDDYIFSPYQKIYFLMNIRLINNAIVLNWFSSKLAKKKNELLALKAIDEFSTKQ